LIELLYSIGGSLINEQQMLRMMRQPDKQNLRITALLCCCWY